MTDDARDSDGRFKPGRSGNPETQWGPGNPPPRSPGRPRRDAWLGELERMLGEDERISRAMAARALAIALKGNDRDSLRALEVVQKHLGGLPTVKAEVAHTIQRRESILIDPRATTEPPPMPQVVLDIEEAEARAREEAKLRLDDAKGR